MSLQATSTSAYKAVLRSEDLQPMRGYRISASLAAALTIIGLIGVCLAGAGGATMGLNCLDQIVSISLMAAGGGGGLFFLLLGLAAAVKSRATTPPHIVSGEYPFVPQIKLMCAEVDTSYDRSDDSGILDEVHLDRKRAFACMFDGAGHGNSYMKGPLKQHFDLFIENYTQNFPAEATEEEITAYVANEICELERRFNNKKLPVNNLPLYSEAEIEKRGTPNFQHECNRPAMSFVQLVQYRNQLTLLTAQAADTMVLVEMHNGTIHTTQPSNIGPVGAHDMKIVPFVINGAKRVIIFSDGIGEFLTLEEVKETIRSTKSEMLFASLKKRILHRPDKEEREIAANGCNLKRINKDSPGGVDDMSLIVIEI